MNRDFDQEIAAAESALEMAVANLAEMHEKIIKAAANFIPQWYEEATRQEVKEQHEVTKKLRPENLSEMKERLKKLKEQAESTARSILGREEFQWPKLRFSITATRGDGVPHDFLTAIYQIAGRLTAVLEKFGYVTERNRRIWYSKDNFRT